MSRHEFTGVDRPLSLGELLDVLIHEGFTPLAECDRQVAEILEGHGFVQIIRGKAQWQVVYIGPLT